MLANENGPVDGPFPMVRPRRFERLASSFGGKRSIQLSYGRASRYKVYQKRLRGKSKVPG